MKRSIIWLLPALLIFSACSEKFEPKPLTYTQLLTGKEKKSWRATGIQIREDNKPAGNFILPENDCLFDDLYVFYANSERTFEVEDSSIKCAPTDPDIIVSDNWAFSNANATLEMYIPFLAPFKLPFVVRELDEDQMVLEIWLDFENTDSYRISFEAIETN